MDLTRGSLRAFRCLEFRSELSFDLAGQTFFQHKRVGKELRSPTNEPHWLMGAPNRIRSGDSACQSLGTFGSEGLLQHLVHLEGSVQVAQIACQFDETQPDARHLRVSGQAGKLLAPSEVWLVGPQETFVRFELAQ